MPNEKLKESLKRLLLSNSSANIDKHIQKAIENNTTYEDFLNDLLNEEIAFRQEHRMKSF